MRKLANDMQQEARQRQRLKRMWRSGAPYAKGASPRVTDTFAQALGGKPLGMDQRAIENAQAFH